MKNDDCPLCRLDTFVEGQRKEGRRRGWSYERTILGWNEALFRGAGCDWGKYRKLAETMLKAGPPVYFELDLNKRPETIFN